MSGSSVWVGNGGAPAPRHAPPKARTGMQFAHQTIRWRCEFHGGVTIRSGVEPVSCGVVGLLRYCPAPAPAPAPGPRAARAGRAGRREDITEQPLHM